MNDLDGYVLSHMTRQDRRRRRRRRDDTARGQRRAMHQWNLVKHQPEALRRLAVTAGTASEGWKVYADAMRESARLVGREAAKAIRRQR